MAQSRKEETKMKMEILIDAEMTPYGTILEEVMLICTMTGFRRRVVVEHTVEGLSRSLEVMA
jgi:hypothetical protein